MLFLDINLQSLLKGKTFRGELVHLMLKGQVSFPDMPPFTLETSNARKRGAEIIKVKGAEALRVRTTHGPEDNTLVLGLRQTLRASRICSESPRMWTAQSRACGS